MIHQIYVVKDTKADSYTVPMFFQNNAVAIREMERAASQPGSQYQTHPEDFILFHIGSFDQGTGEMYSEDVSTVIRFIDIAGGQQS